MVQSVNPRTGAAFGPTFSDTTPAEVNSIVSRAEDAFKKWGAVSPSVRAEVLTAVADAIDSKAASLIDIADQETGLGVPRLTGEVGRTTFQVREFAKAIRAGQFVSPQVDAFVDAPLPVGHPELIRSVQPLGVVVVFGANNFPFAFSVLGGDTASALAAGCSVIAKAHPSHPQTSTAVFEIAAEVFAAHGFQDTLSLIHGVEAGAQVLKSESISAGAFTGSLRGGRALFDIATSRKNPIPFYGELGSVNPVVALESGLTDPKAFTAAYLDSLLLGNGQFCTNPSILFVPAGSSVVGEIESQIKERKPTPFLSPATKSGHDANRSELASLLGATPVVGEEDNDGGLYSAPAVIFTQIGSPTFNLEALRLECFGPTGVVVTYSSLGELIETIDSLEGALTGSIFAGADDAAALDVSAAIAKKVGRISWNGWPTGVAVSIGQQHGGPYPASTSSIHTSVGLHAIERFLRPVSYQNFPASVVEKLLRK
jgi:NADP-dependent aldehyde dehydrogenase